MKNLPRSISNWWTKHTAGQMYAIAITCSMLLSLIFAGIHRMLTSALSTNIAAIIMFSISTVILLAFFLLITLELKSKQKLERLKIHLEHVSVRDPLTNLYNRRFLETELCRMHKRVQRESRRGRTISLGLIFMDMDDLKKINDNNNHRVGDGAICATVDVITDEIREGEDLVSRYGGDEFCAAIQIENYTTKRELLKKVAAVTYRIKKKVRKVIFYSGSERIPLSITIGLHIMDLNEPDVMKELAKADEEMLAKKKRRKIGRNA